MYIPSRLRKVEIRLICAERIEILNRKWAKTSFPGDKERMDYLNLRLRKLEAPGKRPLKQRFNEIAQRYGLPLPYPNIKPKKKPSQ